MDLAKITKDIKGSIELAIEKAGTKSALGRAIGVKSQTVTAWERGSMPGYGNLAKIHTYLESKNES